MRLTRAGLPAATRLAVGALLFAMLFISHGAAAQESGPALPGNLVTAGDPASAGAQPAATDAALGTGFAYQGRLKRNGAAYNGACNFQFGLWDAASGGVQKGAIPSLNNVQVSDGVFTVNLDFGRQFTGDARWVQAAVQCTGDGTFTTLSPRQALAATPYALGLRPGAQVAGNTSDDIISATNNGQGAALMGVSTNGWGVWAKGNVGGGVFGFSYSGTGVTGESTMGHGISGSSDNLSGVHGETAVAHSNGSAGVYGKSTGDGGIGVTGEASYGNSWGVFGRSGAGAGVKGEATSSGLGVWGDSPSNAGVYGHSTNSYGVLGRSDNYDGVHGESAKFPGVSAVSTSNAGVLGVGLIGVQGNTNAPAGSIGVRGDNGGANSGTWAGYFNGRVTVVGNLSKGGGSFTIDHPLDPLNKYLQHSFVESPDMKNIYDGVVALDANGEATVQLPAWFEALNRDFRYQLTCIGGYAPVYVSQEVVDNQFRIAGGKPELTVSWQVTGIRHDPYADQNRIQVEIDKTPAERGKYLYPSAYGRPMQEGIAAQHPELASTSTLPTLLPDPAAALQH